MRSCIMMHIVSWPLYRDAYRDFAGDTQPYGLASKTIHPLSGFDIGRKLRNVFIPQA